jgi:putative ABC transport system permease protein
MRSKYYSLANMFKFYLKSAWRNITNGFSYSAINIIGLSAGLCSFIVILLFLNYELSYDKWDPELSKIYRFSLKEDNDYRETTPAPLAGFLAQKYPNAVAGTSVQSAGDFELLVAAGENKLYQKNVVTVDSNFLKVFPHQLAEGNAATALNNPKAAIITEELSHKLFGNTDPIGKNVKVFNFLDYVVTGILKDQNGATHLPVAMLIRDQFGASNNFWGNYSFQTYIRLKHPENDKIIEGAINRIFYNDHLKNSSQTYEQWEKASSKTALFVDAVPNMHNFPKHGNSRFSTVTILLALAILLLLAGAINFSNLAIAKSINRAREVGLRKILGSVRWQLVMQYLCETGLQCIISLIIAIGLLNLALPYINRSFNINLTFGAQSNSLYILLQIGACLLGIILLSGLYPALYLSRFKAVKVIKGDYSTGKRGAFFRNGLIVVQFMVSVFFIAGTLVIKSQLNYMQSADKGFSGDQVMRVQATQATSEQNFEQTRNTLLAVPGVEYVAKSTKIPGDNTFVDTSTAGFKYNGRPYRMSSVKVSTDYFRAMHVKLKQGRDFTSETRDQNTRTAVINIAAAETFGIANPVGKYINFPGCDSIPMEIVGVVSNFNVYGFESQVQPAVFTIGQKACMFQSGSAILVKLNSGQAQQTIAGITEAWKKIEPAFPIRYSFLDQNFEQLLSDYIRLQKIITFFGLLLSL